MKALHKNVIRYLRARQFWALMIWAAAAAILSGLTAYFEWPAWFYYVALGWVLLYFIAMTLIQPAIYNKVTRYELKEDLLIVRTGFFTVKTRMVPIKRIQGAKLTTGPISRKYKLANVTVNTASTIFMLPPVETEEAQMLKSDIIERVKGELTDV
ncbi:PH domain-containing protein [Salinicoccus albus]|uniref:PH domain-containing protein n=1 Tax=Salinicoccus albus TaxID=418756 RepID=UPI0003792C1B|nr:PH domain-containing protein [Salinicoccus albus]